MFDIKPQSFGTSGTVNKPYVFNGVDPITLHDFTGNEISVYTPAPEVENSTITRLNDKPANDGVIKRFIWFTKHSRSYMQGQRTAFIRGFIPAWRKFNRLSKEDKHV